MKRSKVLATFLAGVMVLSLAGCGSGSGSTGDNGGGSSSGGGSSEAISLEMWCIATESDSNRHSYEAAIADV